MNAKVFGTLSLLFVIGLVVAFVPLPVRFASTGTQRTIRIEAGRYAYTPGEIQVDPGDTVTLELASHDVVHGLYIDGYGLALTADPGQTARLTFVADKTGSFRFRCNVTCGAMHPFMIGRLQVGFNDWLYRSVALAVLAVGGLFMLRRIP